MYLQSLSLARFRGFERALWQPEPGINFVTGDNGAGKTSLLEAAHLLANGRSFRGRVRDGLIRHGCADLEVFAEWRESGGCLRRAGLRHMGHAWEARLDAQPVGSLIELCSAFAVLTFEPGTHEMITGGADQRRRFVDWALFHVEPEFLSHWRRYGRAARQRNTLLKTRPDRALLDSWDAELAAAGESITRMRALHLDRLSPHIMQAAASFVPELGPLRLEFLPGWKRESRSLLEALGKARDRDLAFGHGTVGPHRADWRICFEGLPDWRALSRGQEKLVALSCVLGQARAYAAQRGEWPVIALDDLASELDRTHQQRVLQELAVSQAQTLLTGTERQPVLSGMDFAVSLFHVEQGEVRRLV